MHGPHAPLAKLDGRQLPMEAHVYDRDGHTLINLPSNF